MKLTVKQKLAFGISIINTIAVALIVFAFLFVFNLVSVENIHKDLLREAEEIVTEHLTVEKDRITYTLDGDSFTIEQDLLTDRLSAVIYSKDGNSLGSFGYFQIKQNLEKHSELFSKEVSAVCQTKQMMFKTDSSDKKQQLELLFYPVVSQGECRGVLVVGASLETLVFMRQISLYVAFITVAFVLLANIVFGQNIARALLRPLITIAQKMHEVSVEQQIEPLPLYPANDELSQLTDAFNSMAFRVQEGVAKQKEFIANASHELKTPIARAMSDLDIASLHLGENAYSDAQLSINNAKQDLSSLHEILESLLMTARIKHTGVQVKKLNIEEIFEKELEQSTEAINAMKIHVTTDFATKTITGDIRIWEVIVRNCLQNAIKYNIQGGTILLHTVADNSHLAITIKNSTTLQHTEVDAGSRFARGDAKIKGSGIGLSIVKELCDTVGYLFSINAKGNDFEVVIEINTSLAK